MFGAAVAGGFASIPQSSFTYRSVGVNIEMTPRVTYEGDIRLELSLESSALGPNISVAGQDVPSFSSRKVTTTIRLREGESNLLAGLLRDDQRKMMTGFPGIMQMPILRSLFGQSNDQISQSDIIMLLTPHIVRTHELTASDLAPIFIGTQSNIGLSGPPPLIQAPGDRRRRSGRLRPAPGLRLACLRPGCRVRRYRASLERSRSIVRRLPGRPPVPTPIGPIPPVIPPPVTGCRR